MVLEAGSLAAAPLPPRWRSELGCCRGSINWLYLVCLGWGPYDVALLKDRPKGSHASRQTPAAYLYDRKKKYIGVAKRKILRAAMHDAGRLARPQIQFTLPVRVSWLQQLRISCSESSPWKLPVTS